VKSGLDVDAASQEILSLRLDAVHKPSPASLLSIIGGLIAVYVYWAPGLKAGLLIWLGAIIAVAVTNLVTGYMRMRGVPRDWTNRTWGLFVVGMHLLSGLTWGIGGAWMLTVANEMQALVTLAIGLTVVTVSIPSIIHQLAYNMFHLPIYMIYAFGLLFSSLEYGGLISFGFVLIGAFSTLGRPPARPAVEPGAGAVDRKQAAGSKRLAEHSAALEAANRKLEIESLTDPADRRGQPASADVVRPGATRPLRAAWSSMSTTSSPTMTASATPKAMSAWSPSPRRSRGATSGPARTWWPRLGGEEFAVMLADVSERQALETAEAIRLAVEELNTTRPMNIKRLVTISIGVAVREQDQRRNLDTLMEQADAALYRAKASGRNRVAVAKTGPNRQAVA
jgi:predicted signal transduction protein with EAL and GGDEF domain